MAALSSVAELGLKPPPSGARFSDSVHEQLRHAILGGRLAPGDALPSERQLSDALAVNRHAIREALNRLQQSQLVAVSQGGATRVLDWRTTGGLELLLDLGLQREVRGDAGTLRSIVELRACIGTDVARRCAQRAPQALRAQAAAIAERIAAETDAGRRESENERLWQLLVDGSDNIAYRLALNSLLSGLRAEPGIASELAPVQREAGELRRLAASLRGGNDTGAARAARTLLERPLETLPAA